MHEICIKTLKCSYVFRYIAASYIYFRPFQNFTILLAEVTWASPGQIGI